MNRYVLDGIVDDVIFGKHVVVGLSYDDEARTLADELEARMIEVGETVTRRDLSNGTLLGAGGGLVDIAVCGYGRADLEGWRSDIWVLALTQPSDHKNRVYHNVSVNAAQTSPPAEIIDLSVVGL